MFSAVDGVLLSNSFICVLHFDLWRQSLKTNEHTAFSSLWTIDSTCFFNRSTLMRMKCTHSLSSPSHAFCRLGSLISCLSFWWRQAACGRPSRRRSLCWRFCPSPLRCLVESSWHSGNLLSMFWGQVGSLLPWIYLTSKINSSSSCWSSAGFLSCTVCVCMRNVSPVWMAHCLNKQASLSTSQPWRAACFHGIENIILSWTHKSTSRVRQLYSSSFILNAIVVVTRI